MNVVLDVVDDGDSYVSVHAFSGDDLNAVVRIFINGRLANEQGRW